jgi:hypothetical protein
MEDLMSKYFEKIELEDSDEVNDCFVDNFDDSLRTNADCVIKEWMDISEGIFPYDIYDIAVKRDKKPFEFKRHHRAERLVENTFGMGQTMNRICKELNRIQQGETLDRCGLSHVLERMNFGENLNIWRIMCPVMETLPMNKRIQEEIASLILDISFQVQLRTGGYCIKRDLPTKIFREFDLYSYARKKERVIVQERLLANGFFTKMQSIVDNIYHHFMEIGYDINGGCIQYQVGYAIGW